MASYASPSIEVFRLQNHDIVRECGNNYSNHGHQSLTAVISSFDLETVRSCPGIAKNGSMTSFTTQWSIATKQTSNTRKRHTEEKNKKRRFHHFVKILMGIVKEKDEGRFLNAKAIICDCEQQEKRGEIDSLSESLRCPLKDAVGSQFWREARERLSQESLYSKTKMSSIGATIETGFYSPNTLSTVCQTKEAHSRSPSMVESKLPAKNNVKTNTEMKTGKKRLWMVIRVFMQFLQSKDCQLYRKAHILVNECMRRHGRIRHFDHCNSLSGSIQVCLKKEFGLEHWRRAEILVGKTLPAP